MTFVRPDVAAFLAFLNAQQAPKMSEMDPAGARQMMLAMGQVAELPRGELARVQDFEIDGPHGNKIPLRVYSPRDKAGASEPVLVYYHGGGWVIGDLQTHDPLCAEIARGLDMTVVAVDYRLAPEHRFPAAVDDSMAATRWVAGSPAEIGHKVSGLVVAGDSAGGNLAAVCAQHLSGHMPVPIVAQWLIYPGVDMTAAEGSMLEFAEGFLLTKDTMDWFMQSYVESESDLTDLRASPLFRESLAGQPSALVFTCGLDPLRDQGRAYAGRLIESGVPTIYREAKGQIHGCMNLRQAIPSAQADLVGCLSALRTIIDDASAA